MFELERAWNWRNRQGWFDQPQPLRVFHGPGEGVGESQFFAVDRFENHYWITEWQNKISPQKIKKTVDGMIQFYRTKNAVSIVGLSRPEKGVAPESTVYWGEAPKSRFEVSEQDSRFWIQLEKTRHPGLFLDHAPLRKWLKLHMKGFKVLNTFAYTGSLSVAAGLGGAAQVTTLDLSKTTIQWAKDNMALNGLLNGLTDDRYRFISGDVFEWLPRLKREKLEYDCLILDPPSFSHGKNGNFSTAKDLTRLHTLAIDLLAKNGILITSINSANISKKKYEQDILSASQQKKVEWQTLAEIDLPETFPTRFQESSERYLKGWILKRIEL